MLPGIYVYILPTTDKSSLTLTAPCLGFRHEALSTLALLINIVPHELQAISLPKEVAALDGVISGYPLYGQTLSGYRRRSVGIELTSAFSDAISLSFAIKFIKHSSTLTVPDQVQGRGNGSDENRGNR